jgi:hypothetical protein
MKSLAKMDSKLRRSAPVPFDFESYGVRVRLAGSDQELIDLGEAVSRRSLLGNVSRLRGGKFDHDFQLNRTKGGTFQLVQNGERIASGRSRKKFFKFFDSVIRVSIAELAPARVFLHAGVVGWKGKAIILPADSFKGKSTLVLELVQNGAEYYSDDFAIIDEFGLVHPFARPIGLRTPGYQPYELSVEDLGARSGHQPIPPGLVLFTEYVPNKKFSPTIISPGQGILEMIPFALTLRHRPELSMKALNNVARRAIIASGPRGTANKFVKILLDFIDKCGY